MKITEPTLHLASLELHGIVVTGQCQFFLIFADAAAKQIIGIY